MGDGNLRGVGIFWQFSNFLVSKMMDYLNLWHIAKGYGCRDESESPVLYGIMTYGFFFVAMQMGFGPLFRSREKITALQLEPPPNPSEARTRRPIWSSE